ncbi:MAG TPA: hypothetical protein PKL17_20050, partial [Pseudomonadota bacterium]|nr:hypothetical protein [Pseudomonadota bacterium]
MAPVGFILKRDQPQSVQLCEQLVQVLRERGQTELVLRDHVQLPSWFHTTSETDLPSELAMLVAL